MSKGQIPSGYSVARWRSRNASASSHSTCSWIERSTWHASATRQPPSLSSQDTGPASPAAGGALRDAEAEARAALDSGALYRHYALAVTSALIDALTDQGKLDEAQAAYEATGLGERLPEHRPLTPLLISRGVLRHAQGHRERAVIDLREALERIGRYATGTTAGMDARLLLATTLQELSREEEARAERHADDPRCAPCARRSSASPPRRCASSTHAP